MIDSDEVIRIHNLLIDEFGGSKGVRDFNLLDSAINRPFQTFDKMDIDSIKDWIFSRVIQK